MFAMKYGIKNTDNVSGLDAKSYRTVWELRTQQHQYGTRSRCTAGLPHDSAGIDNTDVPGVAMNLFRRETPFGGGGTSARNSEAEKCGMTGNESNSDRMKHFSAEMGLSDVRTGPFIRSRDCLPSISKRK